MKRLFSAALAALSLLVCASTATAADKPMVYENGPRQLPAATAVQLNASTTGAESLNIPAGTAPSTPSNGMIWATTSGLYSRYGGVTLGPFSNGTVTSVACGTPLTGGTFSVTGTCGIAANGLALSYLAQVGGNSYLGTQSTSTGNVTAYVWPTCTNDGAHALIYVPGASPPITCPTITAAAGGSNPFAIGSANLKSGVGTPSASSDGIGSLYMRTDVSQLWGQIVPSATVPALVQSASGANTSSATFSATPASGDLLVAACTGYTSQPVAGSGWTDSGLTHTPSVFEPGDRWVYKIAVSGESTSQTPCAGGGSGTGVVLFEVSGVASWAGSLESNTFTTGQPVTYTTANANDLVLGAVYAQKSSADPGAATISGLSGGFTTAHACCTGGGTGYSVGGAGQQFASSSSSVSVTYGVTAVTGQSARLIILKPATAGWRQFSWLTNILNAGSSIETSPQSLNFSIGLTATTDGLGAVTITGNTGTVTHTAGSLTSSQLVVGNGSADVTVGNLSGDVSTSGGTTTAIGSNKVTNAMLRQSGALAVVGRSANSTGNVADIQATAASDGVLRESGSTIGFGTINTAGITNAAVTLAKIANASASSKLLGSGSSGSGSSYAEITVGTGLTMTGTTLSTSAGGGTVTNTGTLTAGRLIVGNGGVDVTLGLTDVTTDNCSTSAHGLAPKAPNDSAKFLDGTCNWSVPGGAGGGTVTSVASGAGTNFSTIASSGTITAANVGPTGRLTLVSATCVMTSDQTAKTAIYYTPGCSPMGGNTVPLWDGTNTKPYTYSELTLSLDTTNHPIENVFDAFVWNNSGTISIGAGPAWKNSGTITVTIASPGVVTWTGHGLYEGAPVIFTTTGALPTGITAGTTYYVGKNVTTNTFSISTSVANAAAGTYVNTSGSQSGTHTGTNHTTSRGTGAGTTELELKNGFWANKNSITLTNGAGAGTSGIGADTALYVGSFYTTATGQTGVQFRPSAAAGGSNTFAALCNAYNQVRQGHRSQDNTSSWSYSSATWRAMDGSNSNRVSFVQCLPGDVHAQSNGRHSTGSNTAAGWGMNLDSTSATPATVTEVQTNGTSNLTLSTTVSEMFQVSPGLHYLQEMEATLAGAGAASSWNDTPSAHQLLVDYGT